MKSAMQELIDELDLIKIVEKHNFFMVKYIIEQCLEKEKEQIKDAWDAGMSEGIGTMMADLDWDGEFINYYNETYNQNK